MIVKIAEVTSPDEFDSSFVNQWSQLWWDDFDGSRIEVCYLAFVDDKVVGFQTVNGDGETVAIEVKDDYQGNGIAFRLISASGSIEPEEDYNPEFWSKVASVFGYEDEDEDDI